MLPIGKISIDYRILGNDLFSELIKNHEERCKDMFTDVTFLAVN